MIFLPPSLGGFWILLQGTKYVTSLSWELSMGMALEMYCSIQLGSCANAARTAAR